MASQGEEQLIWNRLLYKEKPSLRQLVLALHEAARTPPLSEEKRARAMDDLEALEFNLDKLELIRLANMRDISEYESLSHSLRKSQTERDLDSAKVETQQLAEKLTHAKAIQEQRIRQEETAAEVNKLRTQEDLQTQLKAVREEARKERDAIHQMESEISQKQQTLQALWQLLQQLTRPEESVS